MTKDWRYKYTYYMHKDLLPVTVHVGCSKNKATNCAFVTLGSNKAEVWFPEHAMGPEYVAHEALHLAEWAQKKLGNGKSIIKEILPKSCLSWNSTLADRKEEVRAHLLDRFVEQFYIQASEHDVLSIWRTYNKYPLVIEGKDA